MHHPGTHRARSSRHPKPVGGRLSPLPFLILAAIALGLTAAPSLEAQVAEPLTVRVIPQVGLYAPMADLGEIRDDDQTVVEAGRRSSSLAWGLGLEFAVRPEGTALRVQGLYATNADVPIGGFDCPECVGRSTVLAGTVAAVIRPVPRLLVVQPHFIVGLGGKQYNFEPDFVEGETWRAVLRDQLRPTFQTGVGAEVHFLGLPTQWELIGLVSTFRTGETDEIGLDPGLEGDRTVQTDLFLTLAIPFGG